MLKALLLVPALLAAACACEPTVHVEAAYASPTMATHIEQCATKGQCTVLCAQTFFLDPNEIDSCRILGFDDKGGATVEVTYTTYTCFADFSDDDWGSDDDTIYDDDDPCSYGGCDDYDPDDYDPDDYDPGDYEDPPPDDDPPEDDDPDMEV